MYVDVKGKRIIANIPIQAMLKFKNKKMEKKRNLPEYFPLCHPCAIFSRVKKQTDARSET